jgi:hypothetical protein
MCPTECNKVPVLRFIKVVSHECDFAAAAMVDSGQRRSRCPPTFSCHNRMPSYGVHLQKEALGILVIAGAAE